MTPDSTMPPVASPARLTDRRKAKNGPPHETDSGRWLIAAGIAVIFCGVCVWLGVGLPRVRLARVAKAPYPQVLRLGRADLGNIPLVELAARRLLAMNRVADALSLVSAAAVKDSGASTADRAALKGVLAEAEVLSGITAAGAADADTALALDPGCTPASVAQALWSERQAQWSDAETQLQQAAARMPDDGVVGYHLALVLIREGKYSRAAAVAARLAASNPGSFDDRRLLAETDAYVGQFAQAADEFKKASALRPADVEASANVVRAAAFSARTEAECRAQEVPVSLLVKSGRHPAIDHEIVGLLELHAGDTVAAQGHLEAAVRAYRSRPFQLRTLGFEFYRNLTFIHVLNGEEKQSLRDNKEAQRFFSPVSYLFSLQDEEKRDSQDPDLHSRLAEIYDQFGAWPEALNQYDEMLRETIDESRVNARIAWLSSRPYAPEPETDWAWRVLSTETCLLMPSGQPPITSG